MIRKWMMMVLALLLAAVLPMNAVADTQHTLSVVPGELLASEEAIADLFEVLDLRLTEGEKSGALTMLLNGQEIVTLGLTADAVGLHAVSNFFGTEVLYVTWDDAFSLLGEVLMASMAESGAEEGMLQSLEAGLAEVKNGLITAINAGITIKPQVSTPATMEESLQMIQEMFPDDPAMVEYIKGLYEEMTIEDGSFADENRDTADQKYRMTMDEEDLVAICETNYMKTALGEALAMEMTDASEEELAKAVEDALAEVKKLYEESGFEMIMEMYTLDAGQTLVGLEMIMNASIEEAEQQSTMQMAAEYDRLTDAEGVSHKADGAMAVDAEKVQFVFDLYSANSGMTTGMIGMLADGEEIVVMYEAENTAPEIRNQKADVYTRSGATAILEPAASARPLFGVVIVTEPAPAETLAALENAAPESSLNVLRLSESELTALGEQILTNAMQALYTALSQLPTSTMNLLMNSGMV